MRPRWPIVVIGISMLLAARGAHAKVPPPGVLWGAAERVPEGPWFDGVGEEDMARAEQLNEAGVTLLLDQRYEEALGFFQAALRKWDHPRVRLNLVRALINLGRTVEAYENLRRALAYGDAPFDRALYSETLSYRALLEKQIATIDMTCSERGARATLDGRFALVCPGRASRYVLAGSHQVVAVKDGFVPEVRTVIAAAGHRASVSISLRRVEDAIVTTRRWAAWKPWAVVGGGIVLSGAGGLLWTQAASHRDAFDQAIEDHCSETGGCLIEGVPRSVRDLERQMVLENRISVAAMVTGGTVVVTGVVLVLLNRARVELPVGTRYSITAAPSGAIAGFTVSF